MPEVSILHGKSIIVKAGEADNNNATIAAIGLQRSMELTESCEMRETAANNNSDQTFRPGRNGWQLSVSGLMSTIDRPLQLQTRYTVQIVDGTNTRQGTAYVSQIKMTGTIGNLAQQSVVFQGTGPLGTASAGE